MRIIFQIDEKSTKTTNSASLEERANCIRLQAHLFVVVANSKRDGYKFRVWVGTAFRHKKILWQIVFDLGLHL